MNKGVDVKPTGGEMGNKAIALNHAKEGIDSSDFSELTEPREGWCVSLYLPLVTTGRELHQSPIRLKNLRGRAYELLREKGMRGSDLEAFFEPLDNHFSTAFIDKYQGQGLCLFLAEGFFRCFYPPLRFDEFVHLGHRFHLKPLLPLISEGRRSYLVLALGLHQTRLFRMTLQSMEEMDLPGVPSTIEGALNKDVPEQGQQFYTGTPSQGPGRMRPAIFFGTGGGRDGREMKREILQYFKIVDGKLQGVMANERDPLLLAGIDYLLPLFRDASAYGNILDEAITVNSEGMSVGALHALAWEKVKPQRDLAVTEALEKYRAKMASGLGGNDLFAVVPAAAYGRVEQLFLPGGRNKWGAFDMNSGRVEIHSTEKENSVDLLDLAAAQTLRNNGEVFVLDAEAMPDHTGIAAGYRY